jgi:hypothetical protein
LTESEIEGRVKERNVNLLSTETAVLEPSPTGWQITHLHWSSRDVTKK